MSGSSSRATTCYMADESERGVAYDFWLRVNTELSTLGWSDVELHRRTGVARSTVDNMKSGRRAPNRATVTKLADALRIDQAEAHRLARGLPASTSQGAVDAREAVRNDPKYTGKQRQAMLDLMDIFDQANRGPDDDDAEQRDAS